MALILRSTNFGNVLGSNIFESLAETWYGKIWQLFHRKEWGRMTYVSSPISLHPVVGRKHPRFVRSTLRGHALVARGLANRGLLAHLQCEEWQQRTSPFLISFFSIKDSTKERFDEFCEFVVTLRENSSLFKAPIALEIDTTVNHRLQIHDHEILADELRQMLDFASKFGIPLIPKIGIAVPKGVAQLIASHPACDGLSLHSGIPWGAYSERLDWKRLFGSQVSPFSDEGNGELYGAPCMPILKAWLQRDPINIDRPLIAASCIYSVDDARDIVGAITQERLRARPNTAFEETYQAQGRADTISLGAVALLRPWRVASLVRYMEGKIE